MAFPQLSAITELIHFPGLKEEEKANIYRIGFYRRKPRGFSNGHYLQVSPEQFLNNKAFKVKLFSFYTGGFIIFNALFALQQRKKQGSWKWIKGGNYNQFVPPYFNDSYLKQINRYKE